ncbi:hypothetical protein B0H34DRAFT_682041 [Crassisporium funariophilum]|nr:hypothetical protein B0H34DRAFT_682041 [Crassisporium funariophilum]
MNYQLFALLRGFFSLTPPNALEFPSSLSPTQINEFLLNSILLGEHCQLYPPSTQWQKQFWKWAIANLEELSRTYTDAEHDDDFEIDPRIYAHYLALLPPAGPVGGLSDKNSRSQLGRGIPLSGGPPSPSYITHIWDFNDPCNVVKSGNVDPDTYYRATLLESRTTIESGTTGLRTWFASFVLSQYLILHPGICVACSIQNM